MKYIFYLSILVFLYIHSCHGTDPTSYTLQKVIPDAAVFLQKAQAGGYNTIVSRLSTYATPVIKVGVPVVLMYMAYDSHETLKELKQSCDTHDEYFHRLESKLRETFVQLDGDEAVNWDLFEFNLQGFQYELKEYKDRLEIAIYEHQKKMYFGIGLTLVVGAGYAAAGPIGWLGVVSIGSSTMFTYMENESVIVAKQNRPMIVKYESKSKALWDYYNKIKNV